MAAGTYAYRKRPHAGLHDRAARRLGHTRNICLLPITCESDRESPGTLGLAVPTRPEGPDRCGERLHQHGRGVARSVLEGTAALAFVYERIINDIWLTDTGSNHVGLYPGERGRGVERAAYAAAGGAPGAEGQGQERDHDDVAEKGRAVAPIAQLRGQHRRRARPGHEAAALVREHDGGPFASLPLSGHVRGPPESRTAPRCHRLPHRYLLPRGPLPILRQPGLPGIACRSVSMPATFLTLRGIFGST